MLLGVKNTRISLFPTLNWEVIDGISHMCVQYRDGLRRASGNIIMLVQ